MTTQTTHLVPALLCTIWAIIAPLIGFVAGYICGATKKDDSRSATPRGSRMQTTGQDSKRESNSEIELAFHALADGCSENCTADRRDCVHSTS